MPRRAGSSGLLVANRGGQGGGLSRVQGHQERARQRFGDLGMCALDARAAAEGRRIWCQDCQEIYDKEMADNGPAD